MIPFVLFKILPEKIPSIFTKVFLDQICAQICETVAYISVSAQAFKTANHYMCAPKRYQLLIDSNLARDGPNNRMGRQLAP
jgi:hypothetical protein